MNTNEINTVGMAPAFVGKDLIEGVRGIKEIFLDTSNSAHESYATVHDMSAKFSDAFTLRYNSDDCTPEERAQIHVEMERLQVGEASISRMENEDKYKMFMGLAAAVVAIVNAFCNAARHR